MKINNPALKATKAVYCYYSPEVRELMCEAEVKIAPELFLLSTPIKKLGTISTLFSPPLGLTSQNGLIDLDLLHEPVIERVVQIYERALPGLRQFAFKYPTSGSSEGLFHLVAKLAASGVRTIYTLAGEYEGFSAYAQCVGITNKEVDLEHTDLSKLRHGFWIISSPSARDGNYLPEDLVKMLCNLGHQVIVDLAYFGMTEPIKIDLTHPNIYAAVISLSKPFGLFRFRIGYTFSRREIQSLYGNRWFKDITRHLQGLHVLEQLGLKYLQRIYSRKQRAIVDSLAAYLGVPLQQSDTFLLANLPERNCPGPLKDQFAPYLRNHTYRFCLTPYFEELERQPQWVDNFRRSTLLKEVA